MVATDGFWAGEAPVDIAVRPARQRAHAMKALAVTAELLRVAQRVIWFEEPVRALTDPVQFLAHGMVFGAVEDLKALRGIVGKDDYREVLEQAPPGIFDARSDRAWRQAPPIAPAAAAQYVKAWLESRANELALEGVIAVRRSSGSKRTRAQLSGRRCHGARSPPTPFAFSSMCSPTNSPTSCER
jgi:hypothetical protein